MGRTSGRRIEIRLNERDRRSLDLLGEAFGVSRSGVVRFLLRQWEAENKVRQTYVQVPVGPTPV